MPFFTLPALAQVHAGTFTVTGGTSPVDWEFSAGVLTIKTSTPITIANTSSGATTDRIEVEANATSVAITLSGVSIAGLGAYQSPLRLNTGAAVTLNLADGTTNTLTANDNGAGIQIENGASLTINGTGTLNAQGGDYYAGIGGRSGSAARGTITINGGSITSTGGAYGGAGISGGNGGTITISGGTVNATGGDEGAGIGGCSGNSSGGTITISGGTVNATGGDYSAGIGGGSSGAGKSGGTITISGDAEITATGGGGGGAGIGGGGGTVIGGGGGGGTITISGNAEVTATGSGGGAGIGGGSSAGGFHAGGGGGTITISGNAEITATGSSGGAGIGGGGAGGGIGGGGGGGNILIYGENTTVTATNGGGGAQDIGAGNGSSSQGNIFVALPLNNLKNSSNINLGNAVKVTSTHNVVNTIEFTATLPASFTPSTITLFNGITAATGRTLSVITTLGSTDNVVFSTYPLLFDSDITKTGDYLMAPPPNPTPTIDFVYTPPLIPPQITAGPTSMTLTEGYAATSSNAFTIVHSVSGPTVVTTSGNAAITWNNTTLRLDIAAGLPAGTYPVVITAANGVAPNATWTFTLTVNNASQAAPTGLGKTDETAVGANDGTITGVTPAMEYRLSTDIAYTPVTGTTITGLAPGTYFVRFAAAPSYNAGADATITIAAFQSLSGVNAIPTLNPMALVLLVLMLGVAAFRRRRGEKSV
jgi:hypothetical protein